MRDRKGVYPDGRGREEELRRIKEGESITRIYYVRENPIYHKREKINLRSSQKKYKWTRNMSKMFNILSKLMK